MISRQALKPVKAAHERYADDEGGYKLETEPDILDYTYCKKIGLKDR